MCEPEQRNVNLITAGNYMAVVDYETQEFIWVIQINTKMKKRVYQAIKKNNWYIMNHEQYTWIDNYASPEKLTKLMNQVYETKETIKLKTKTVVWNEEQQKVIILNF